MANSGSVTVNFGAVPTDFQSVVIADATIGVNPLVEAWLADQATAEHVFGDAAFEDMNVTAGNVQAGVGFTINCQCVNSRTSGHYVINWAYYP